jgi:rhamnogalacturonan endolyase
MGINGYLPAGSRGRVTAVGIAGRVSGYNYTVGFKNATAQYWANAAASNGYFDCRGMRPGTYEMTIYKNELAVKTVPNIVVTSGGTNILNTQTITADPESTPVLWRIGKWDGRPSEFLHGNKVTSMHPSDVRITGSTTDFLTAWKPGLFDTSGITPSTSLDFPCYLWSGVNSGQEIRFNLTQAQKDSGRTVRIGVTCGYGPGRPQVQIGGWSSSPAPYDQPDSRSLTVGTYRGNNITYTVNIPSTRLVVGQNTMRVAVIGNTPGYTPFLTAGISIDCIDMLE